MGLFDYIKCEFPVPDPEHQDDEFQVHGLDHIMTRYSITSDGRLIHHAVRYERVLEEESPSQSTPGSWDHIFQSSGSLKPMEKWDEEIPFHGDLFLHSTGGVDYVARFTDGRIQWIKRAEDVPETGWTRPWR